MSGATALEADRISSLTTADATAHVALNPAGVNGISLLVPAVSCATAGYPLRTLQVHDHSANPALEQLQD